MPQLASVTFAVNFDGDADPSDFLARLAALFNSARVALTAPSAPAPKPPTKPATASVPSVPDDQKMPEIPSDTPSFDVEASQRKLDEAAAAPKKGRGRAKAEPPATKQIVDDPIPDFLTPAADEPAEDGGEDVITVGALRVLGNTLLDLLKENNKGRDLLTRTMKGFGKGRYPDLTPEERAEAYAQWWPHVPASKRAALQAAMDKAPAE